MSALWPAGDLEELVIGRLRAFVTDPGAIQDAIQDDDMDAVAIAKRLQAAHRLGQAIETQSLHELRANILGLVRRVEVHRDRVDIHMSRDAIRRLRNGSADARPLRDKMDDHFVLSAAVARARIGKEVRLVIAPSQESSPARRDPALIKLLVKAHAARRAVEIAPQMSIEELWCYARWKRGSTR